LYYDNCYYFSSFELSKITVDFFHHGLAPGKHEQTTSKWFSTFLQATHPLLHSITSITNQCILSFFIPYIILKQMMDLLCLINIDNPLLGLKPAYLPNNSLTSTNWQRLLPKSFILWELVRDDLYLGNDWFFLRSKPLSNF
jgi:hypothetical protein